jgi:hypothetical protein
MFLLKNVIFIWKAFKNSFLREICKLSMFENIMLRRVFGTKRDAVTGERRKGIT